MTAISQARSTIDLLNLDEVLQASSSKASAVRQGQAQYETPKELAVAFAGLLPSRYPKTVFDPQCAGGNLFNGIFADNQLGIEIDKRHAAANNVITGNCVDIAETIADVFPDKRFDCIVANPPFGLRWKTPTGNIDSTEYTWELVQRFAAPRGAGYFIANHVTIERLGIHNHPWVYLYQRFPEGIWKDVAVQIGVVHWCAHETAIRKSHVWDHIPDADEIGLLYNSSMRNYFPDHSGLIGGADLGLLHKVVSEERRKLPEHNIWLNERGFLRTYLSTRRRTKLTPTDINDLVRVDGAHPLALTPERSTRLVLSRLIDGGIYTISDDARAAITDALAAVASMATPIMPVTDFEMVAYADEEDRLVARTAGTDDITLTPGRSYAIATGTYSFTEKFQREKIHYSEERDETYTDTHTCSLSGQDRYIEITDDAGLRHRFQDRPTEKNPTQHRDSLLWELFERPVVKTIEQVFPDRYAANLNTMAYNEMLAGFNYYEGQRDYYARMAIRDYGLVAAETGTGKSLGALTLHALKAPRRTLLIAPQGTMRGPDGVRHDHDDAAQWVKEIRKFAPCEPVFQLFSHEDYRRILARNGGALPDGIYITYPQAMFRNRGREYLPKSWDEERFCKEYRLEVPDNFDEDDGHYSAGVGAINEDGIQCVVTPCLSTLINAEHPDAWEMVLLDEAHLICNLSAQVTRSFIRLQPKYRFALTATPIPNIVTNLFSLMGWLCVEEWYCGDRRNAAWPYALDDVGRFESYFLTTERDETQETLNRIANPNWRGTCKKVSPVISAPARLLKILKPNLAHISLAACNPDIVPCEVIDVRVPMGRQQKRLYTHYTNRGNIIAPAWRAKPYTPLDRARIQTTYLRGICADPFRCDYNNVANAAVRSNFNPKTVTILSLINDCLAAGEQVVVVSARVGQSDEISNRLTSVGITHSRIDSTVLAKHHAAEANRFKSGAAKVCLMGIKCAQAYSFDACPNLIIGSLEWSYGALHQAKGRVYRLTSPKAVRVWVVLHSNSIEEALFDRVATKQDAATICLRGERLPRDFKTLDAAEVLARHIIEYDTEEDTAVCESECESQWPELAKALSLAA